MVYNVIKESELHLAYFWNQMMLTRFANRDDHKVGKVMEQTIEVSTQNEVINEAGCCMSITNQNGFSFFEILLKLHVVRKTQKLNDCYTIGLYWLSLPCQLLVTQIAI